MNRRTVWQLTAIVALFISAILSGCGGSGGVDVQTSFGPPTKTTTYVFNAQIPTISSNQAFYGVIGEKVVQGQTYERHKGGYGITDIKDLNDNTQGAEFWYSHPSAETLVAAGYEETGVRTVTLDQPLSINLNPPVNTPQTITASGMAQVPGGQAQPASGTADFQMISSDEMVDTGIGPIHGCRHFSGSIILTGAGVPDVARNLQVAGELWYHPDFGMVSVKVPTLGVTMGLDSTADLGDTSSGSNTIKKMGVVGAGAATSFTLSTYDVHGQNDATKMEHAQMFLELRWAKEQDAKTKDMPAYPMFNASFNTIVGTFPYQFTESPISIFHPEENGHGYRYWYAYVNEAAKNEPGADGISYSIDVTADSSLSPVRCTARIYYKLVQP